MSREDNARSTKSALTLGCFRSTSPTARASRPPPLGCSTSTSWRRSAQPRIVNVSSGTGSLTWSTGPNPQFDYRTGGTGAAYRSSKAALNALTVYYAQALAAEGFKVNALAPGLRATNLNTRAASSGRDPAEAAAGVVRLALLPDDGPTGQFFSWDGTLVPW
jgi:NAD(P)-dependent dehydrogenase (short-subunit alcohol dehydrogenase family)